MPGGCRGSGVGLAPYLGTRLGPQVPGLKEGGTAFGNIAFPTRPVRSGNPRFLAPSVLWYRLRDSWGR